MLIEIQLLLKCFDAENMYNDNYYWMHQQTSSDLWFFNEKCDSFEENFLEVILSKSYTFRMFTKAC